jgi:hypothetical protein
MNIYEAINAVMSDIGAIGKDSKNQSQGFNFRGIDAVMNALSPALIKNHIFIVPEVLEQTREERTTTKGSALIYSVCRVKYTFYAEDGSSISAVVIGEGMDSGDKATNKAMSIAFKYACFQVFCIPTKEMADPDADTHEVIAKKVEEEAQAEIERVALATISATKVKALNGKAEKDNVDTAKLCGLYKVNTLGELTEKQYRNISDNWQKIVEQCAI